MKRLLSGVFILMAAANFSPAWAQSDISCGAAWEKINSGVMLIDVRPKEEFDAGHLKKAVHIPEDVIDVQIVKVQPDKKAEILLYCRSGKYSGIAKETLLKMGYKRVVNIGGYEALKNCKR